ncbi:MAG: bifunctional metallophosphatase/5'-nucleotidase [Muribaculaceae bacterium]|nr:bifunctional metallophosphatase/5'-nucleotidase [Muribaculaceae bacterium]
MKLRKIILMAMAMTSVVAFAVPTQLHIKVVETTDSHGNIFPYNFITRQAGKGGLSRVSTYVNSLRAQSGDDCVILLDGGDNLQGQPSAYYYNAIDTVSEHLLASAMNYMRYDAAVIGNHDIEAGHSVYDRLSRQFSFPLLGANVIRTKTGRPYFLPYTIIKRQGVKIAIIGITTPTIPQWVPQNLWEGMRFNDIQKTAEYWIRVLNDFDEKPDIVIGLFHSGLENKYKSPYYSPENASFDVASQVPGFDIIFMGHDHQRYKGYVDSSDGSRVLLLNPGYNIYSVAVADIDLTIDNGKVTKNAILGEIVDLGGTAPDPNFNNRFAAQYQAVSDFVSRKVGTFDCDISTRDAYFGPSAFVDLLHQIQLDISGADISFAAPLAFDATIKAGDIYVSDLFSLYRYENRLYVMELSGKEIKDYLEYSYYLWTKQMYSAKDNLLWFKNEDPSTHNLQNLSYNFDTAAGIIYTVDVTKPKGEKINIISMADGKRFDPTRIYRVAVNSYRGNGGGGLLTDGAGIWRSMLKRRVVSSTERDLRYYIMKRIEEMGTVSPKPLNQWKFIPEEIVGPAIERNRKDLFGS